MSNNRTARPVDEAKERLYKHIAKAYPECRITTELRAFVDAHDLTYTQRGDSPAHDLCFKWPGTGQGLRSYVKAAQELIRLGLLGKSTPVQDSAPKAIVEQADTEVEASPQQVEQSQGKRQRKPNTQAGAAPVSRKKPKVQPPTTPETLPAEQQAAEGEAALLAAQQRTAQEQHRQRVAQKVQELEVQHDAEGCMHRVKPITMLQMAQARTQAVDRLTEHILQQSEHWQRAMDMHEQANEETRKTFQAAVDSCRHTFRRQAEAELEDQLKKLAGEGP